MISMKEWMELVDYRITEGGEYYENTQTLYCLTSWDVNKVDWSLIIVFDPKHDHLIHAVEVCDYKNNRAYRRKITEFVGSETAWDDVNFVDLESDDDFFQKALAIKSGKSYDTRVSIPLEIPDDELFKYMKIAHERDITFNQLVTEALTMAIDKYKLRDKVDLDEE